MDLYDFIVLVRILSFVGAVAAFCLGIISVGIVFSLLFVIFLFLADD